ncbi:hypothetical protein OKW76_05945 [Sphingomonas sp. S1-29]|uniref:hypothetical protein n=1 Tax=Sphingomonas sp. S1-29 TaxID=2991074 RepID=UPI002240046A|nr:hypothetical protein [Sphingomonas sp. S1-29]UZK70575.1 hypothetical protein OKW76_05945 [Sphingomonas sp. S1-29]
MLQDIRPHALQRSGLEPEADVRTDHQRVEMQAQRRVAGHSRAEPRGGVDVDLIPSKLIDIRGVTLRSKPACAASPSY